jgi:hypothetical protein
MSWGYGGSGPADLARSLLIAVLGDDAKCRECKGTGYTIFEPDGDGDYRERPYDRTSDGLLDEMDPETWSKCWCEQGYRHLPYQDFKWEFVAKWGDSFRVSRSEILAWLATHDVDDT